MSTCNRCRFQDVTAHARSDNAALLLQPQDDRHEVGQGCERDVSADSTWLPALTSAGGHKMAMLPARGMNEVSVLYLRLA